jgi:hypothetical protein
MMLIKNSLICLPLLVLSSLFAPFQQQDRDPFSLVAQNLEFLEVVQILVEVVHLG